MDWYLLRNILPFLEPKDSLLCSKGPVTGPHPEPVDSSAYPPTFFSMICFNIILPAVHRSVTGYHSFRTSRQTLNAFLIAFKCATWPFHLIFLDFIILICGYEYQLQRYLPCNCLLSPVIPSLLGSHFILSSLYVNTVCVLSLLREQVPQ